MDDCSVFTIQIGFKLLCNCYKVEEVAEFSTSTNSIVLYLEFCIHTCFPLGSMVRFHHYSCNYWLVSFVAIETGVYINTTGKVKNVKRVHEIIADIFGVRE